MTSQVTQPTLLKQAPRHNAPTTLNAHLAPSGSNSTSSRMIQTVTTPHRDHRPHMTVASSILLEGLLQMDLFLHLQVGGRMAHKRDSLVRTRLDLVPIPRGTEINRC